MTRRARMLAGLLLCGALAAAPAPAQAAETEVGSVAVKGGPGDTATSTFQLKAGVKYRIEVTGTARVASGSDSSSFDALYCFQASSSGCSPAAPESRALGLAQRIGTGEPPTEDFVAFTDLSPNRPAYNAGHTYSGPLTPSRSGPLFLKAWPYDGPQLGVSRSGGFTVTVFAADGTCPRGEKPSGIPGCDFRAEWTAKADVGTNQKGPGSISRVEVRGSGELLFGKLPRVDVFALPQPEGFLRIVIRHRAHPDVNGGQPYATTYRFEPRYAKVKYTKTFRSLDYSARLVRIATRGETRCGVGDPGSIKLIQRGTTQPDEISLEFDHNRSTCLTFSSRDEGVRVKIGKPEKT